MPLDDEATYRMIRTTRTLGCFQIESPGQRELIGKFGPERFDDLIIDISLFRPGPVKSDMITPFLETRHGWRRTRWLHPSLIPSLQETEGVVVYHEQVLRIVAETTGVSLAQADEVRRAMGSPQGQEEIERWWRPAAAARGYEPEDVDAIWAVLKSFASFGFCKAHAAAFALPTYHSAWLKTHHPAAFLSGVLTHDPGMYPKRLILDDARTLGITVLPLDVNASHSTYRVERMPVWTQHVPLHPDLPDGSAWGIRVSLVGRLRDQRGGGRADRRRAAVRRPRRLLATGAPQPPDRREARARRRVRRALRDGDDADRARPARPGDPARRPPPRRRARPVGARGVRVQGRAVAARSSPRRAPPPPTSAPSRRASRRRRARPPPPPTSPSSSPSTSATGPSSPPAPGCRR